MKIELSGRRGKRAGSEPERSHARRCRKTFPALAIPALFAAVLGLGCSRGQAGGGSLNYDCLKFQLPSKVSADYHWTKQSGDAYLVLSSGSSHLILSGGTTFSPQDRSHKEEIKKAISGAAKDFQQQVGTSKLGPLQSKTLSNGDFYSRTLTHSGAAGTAGCLVFGDRFWQVLETGNSPSDLKIWDQCIGRVQAGDSYLASGLSPVTFAGTTIQLPVDWNRLVSPSSGGVEHLSCKPAGRNAVFFVDKYSAPGGKSNRTGSLVQKTLKDQQTAFGGQEVKSHLDLSGVSASGELAGPFEKQSFVKSSSGSRIAVLAVQHENSVFLITCIAMSSGVPTKAINVVVSGLK